MFWHTTYLYTRYKLLKNSQMLRTIISSSSIANGTKPSHSQAGLEEDHSDAIDEEDLGGDVDKVVSTIAASASCIVKPPCDSCGGAELTT